MNAAVVYWSGTGNTEAMAQAVAEGIQAAGGTAEVCEVGQTDADTIQNLIKLRSAARLWEQSSWKTAKWSRSWKNWSR